MNAPPNSTPPCVVFEDEHLLVVNKPPGRNTHAPSPFAGEGIYDWLKHREPRWADLAIVHRLDTPASGVMVFAKTPLAHRALTQQFAAQMVKKKYRLLTDRILPPGVFTVKSKLVRVGERYLSRVDGKPAETKFEVNRAKSELPNRSGFAGPRSATCLEAWPLTGGTHQIRVHAAERGCPILGDTLYGGRPWPRVCLHAEALTLRHPLSGQETTFDVPADFTLEPPDALRAACIEPATTDAFRLIHGASDEWPGWYVDRVGAFLLSQSESALTPAQRTALGWLLKKLSGRGAYHKILTRHLQQSGKTAVAPQLVLGEPAPARFAIRENGVQFELSFAEGYSPGLFLDQRDNRRRFLTGHVAAGFPLFPNRDEGEHPQMLNCFAYTCGFAVCAARAGMRTTNVDLSKKYLDWGRQNFQRNGLDPGAHAFLSGDVFVWLKRLAKKARRFDVIVLDPPTFSHSKDSGAFRAEKDYGRLLHAALPLLRRGGVLFCATNAATWAADRFVAHVRAALKAGQRTLVREHYVPQPPDFPVSRAEPAYLKTLWLWLD